MNVRASHHPSNDCLIVREVGQGQRYVYPNALDGGFTFERVDRASDEVVGYEFFDFTTYHRQGDGWDLPMEEPDIEFQVVDGPDRPMKLLELLDWAMANREKIRWSPSA